MKSKLLVHPEVYDQLYEIVSFLSRLSPGAAVTLVNEFNDVLTKISEYPMLFPEYEDSGINVPGYRKAVVNHNFVIVYSVGEGVIHIELLLDCRRNNKWLLDDKFTLHEQIARQMANSYQVNITRIKPE